jgi:RNA polymerase sigma factor (sigma-70 family)
VKTDAQLIRDARTGPDALGELYSRHARTIHRWLLGRTPERIAVELTAETFAQAALSLRRFRDEANGSAAPWLFGIARNLLRKYLQHERVETNARSKLGMPESYELDLDAAVERVDAGRLAPALRSALAALPNGQRDALELRVVEGRSYEEVAASLGCTEVAARLRVLRARTSLLRILKGAI